MAVVVVLRRSRLSREKNIIENYETAAVPFYTMPKSHKPASISYFFSFCLVMCTKSGNQAMRTEDYYRKCDPSLDNAHPHISHIFTSFYIFKERYLRVLKTVERREKSC